MGKALVSAILEKAAVLLEDQSHATWPLTELLKWANEGQRVIVSLRPDAKTRVQSAPLVAGSKQSISHPDLRVLDIPRAMSGAEGTGTRAIRYVNRAEMDLEMPTWHAATQKPEVRFWMYDQRVPDTFWVYPPNDGTGYVELITSALPEDCELTDVDNGDQTSAIDIDDIWEPALVDYVVFRAQMKDAEQSQTGGKADLAWKVFSQKLGIKTQADKANRPEKSNPPLYESPPPANQGVFGSER